MLCSECKDLSTPNDVHHLVAAVGCYGIYFIKIDFPKGKCYA
jgi:hypothetical protein